MQAVWSGQVIAAAPKEELLFIEGNWYFPPQRVQYDYLKQTETHTVCHWKGEASYFTIVVDGKENKDAAWYYPVPQAGSTERVRADFANYVAFWRGVEIIDA